MKEKRTSIFENGLIWFGAGVSLAEILTGTAFAPLGFQKGILAIIIGHIIGCTMLFLAGVIGGKTRRSAMETVKMSFGQNGGVFFSFLNVLQLVGWTAIMIYDGALAADGVLNTGRWVWCLVIGALIIVWILVGITNLGKYDIAQIMVKAGLGIAGLLIIVFSTVTTTFLDAYSAGISAESVFSKLNGKYAAVAVTVIGTVGAIVYPMDNITDFLYLIGSVFAPMIAIQIADFFILKRADSLSDAIDVTNIVIWIVGFVLYRYLMGVDIPVGNTLPDMAVTIVICVIIRKCMGSKKA